MHKSVYLQWLFYSSERAVTRWPFGHCYKGSLGKLAILAKSVTLRKYYIDK